jgi:lipopolysaccharide export system permease protein
MIPPEEAQGSPFRSSRSRLERIKDWIPVRCLDRYLMKQFLICYVICTTAVLGLFVVIEGLSRLDNFLKQDVSLPVVIFSYFAATLPLYFTQYLGPVFTLLAGMFALTLLNKSNELVPMKVCAISIQRILAPFFLLALVLALAMVLVQEFVIPNLKDQIRISTSYGNRNDSIHPQPIADNNNQLISVHDYLPHKKRGTYVKVIKLAADEGRIEEMWRARELVYREPGYWVLVDGNVIRLDEQGRYIRNPAAARDDPDPGHFDELRLETDMRPVDLESSDRDIPYLSWGELRDQYKRRPYLTHLEVKLHQRFAFPLANFILLLLGFPFILRGENKSVILGVGAAVGIAALYLLTTTICADLGNKGSLPPIIAAWLPILFFGALGLTLFDSIES